MPCVLVVEDDEQVRVLAESIIQDAGYRTVSASCVDEALALLAGDISIEILFTDIALAGDASGGLTVAQKARELRPKLCVLYTTGEGVTDGTKAMFVEGAAFLPKPYTADLLTQAVREVLDNSGPPLPS
jgi:DNA-binding NtrC family response regulator